jgi:hypothetical protein
VHAYGHNCWWIRTYDVTTNISTDSPIASQGMALTGAYVRPYTCLTCTFGVHEWLDGCVHWLRGWYCATSKQRIINGLIRIFVHKRSMDSPIAMPLHRHYMHMHADMRIYVRQRFDGQTVRTERIRKHTCLIWLFPGTQRSDGQTHCTHRAGTGVRTHMSIRITSCTWMIWFYQSQQLYRYYYY